ncbi:Clp protease ClpP [Vagococcus carniphilus]|uniref:head maturation protease, ClpP-related n=1 Tax=Vagococcus carniphilus TaxID=218144 RepID=UPI002890E058|nr:head maturation protease, ClpP-related [Vagococcus carniphilus]MDT2815970.1 Clp protease ClpP [Vagococcus carniphilus]
MTTKIKINGPIISNDDKWIYDWLEWDGTCPKDVLNALPTDNSDVEVTINSYGGLVDSGNEIYTALMSYQGNVTINVIMAGSAASIIAMAGKPTKISPVGQIMIHNAAMGAGGDYHTMDKASEILKKANISASKAYEIKTGLTQEDLLSKMDYETWLTADEAKELGFVDEIMFENNERPLMVASGYVGTLPNNLIQKVKELKMNSIGSQQPFELDKLQDMINQSIELALEKQNKKNQEPIMEDVSPYERFFFNTQN